MLGRDRCRRLVICPPKKLKKSVRFKRAPCFCQWDGHSWELVLGALDIISMFSRQLTRNTTGKRD